MIKFLKNQKGFSLVQAIIGIGISAIALTAILSMMAIQSKEQLSLGQKLAALDLQRQLTNALADGSVCKHHLNRAGISFDATQIGSANPPVIPLTKIQAQASATSPSVAEVDKAVSAYDKFQVARIEVKNFVDAGLPNKYSAELIVNFKAEELVRSLRPITLPLTLNTTGPMNAKTIESCVTSGEVAADCPTGYTLIGEPGKNESFCIETNPHSPAHAYNTIHRACITSNPSAHFCSLSEWGAACASLRVPSMEGSTEHTGTYSNWGDNQAHNIPMRTCRSGNVDLGVYGWTHVQYDFRCCLRP